MKKRKLKTHPLPPEYDYMDALDHDGWRWEFLRRSEAFRADHKSVVEKHIHHFNNEEWREWWDLGEKYSMTKEARAEFLHLDPSVKYTDLPVKVKPVFEETSPVKSMPRQELLKAIRQTLKYWAYAGKENPILHMEPEERILLAVEMSLRPGMYPKNVEYMGINMDASRTDLRAIFDEFLKSRIRPKTAKGDEKKYFGAHKTAVIVWDLRAFRKTFHHIKNVTGMDKDTAKKKFYRAYELIYGKAFEPAVYERPPIRKKYMENYCAKCKQRGICKEPCPEVVDYVEQDAVKYQRERTYSDVDILTKKSKGIMDEDDVEEMSEEDYDDQPE